MTEASTYSLRLPRSLKKAVTELCEEDGTSMNQFIVVAVAEKVSALNTAKFILDRQARADLDAFQRILTRAGGDAPRPGDELPE